MPTGKFMMMMTITMMIKNDVNSHIQKDNAAKALVDNDDEKDTHIQIKLVPLIRQVLQDAC